MALDFSNLSPEERVTAIFVGYYNRAPAVPGKDQYVNDFSTGQTPADVARSFVPQTETLNLYPSLNSAEITQADAIQLVTDVFQNLFNRAPTNIGPDNFWVNKLLTEEGVEVGQVILDIMSGAQGNDLAVLQNKIDVGLAYVTAAEAAGDNGTGALKDTILDNVDATPGSVSAATATIGAAFPVSGETIILTTSQDQPGGGAGADTQGTGDADSYSATISANGTGTLQDNDLIAAGGGTDSLAVRVISLGNGETVAPAATGLEEIIVDNQATNGTFVLNFVAIGGETSVTSTMSGSTNGLFTDFTNLDEGTNIRLVDMDGETTASFKGDRSASTNDVIDLYVENSGSLEDSAVFYAATTAPASDTTFEIVNIETSGTGSSVLDLQGMELLSLVVTGDQKLFLEDTDDNFSTIQTVNANGMTAGGLAINAEDNNVSSFSFIGSGEADSLELNNALFNNANTLSLNGNGGLDTLIVETFANLSPSSINQVTGFEILEASNAVSSLAASDYTNFDTFVFAGQTSNSSRLNITGITNQDNFIFTSDQGQSDETVRFSGQNAGTSISFEMQAQSGAGGEIRIVTNTNSGNDNAAIGFGNSNISSVEIVSSGTNTEANVIRSVDTGSNLYYAFDNQNGPNNFAISGSQALTITAEVGVNLNASSDERGFESAVNLDASDATGNLRIAGSGSADVLQGGSGDDILYGLGGDNVLIGNDGSDQFRFSNWSGSSTLQDFVVGQDKIGLERVDFGNTNATSAGATLNSNDYIENVSSITGMSNAESDRVVELQSTLSQNQIENQTGSATDAYVLVFNSTSGRGELWFDADWSTTGGRSQTAIIDDITDLVGLTGLSNSDIVEYTF
ncbi:hypothetical protein [Marivita sp.]|uniref:hypothetical protein n=1 Tax=Marivita sp. TaxID=2003365 RepID=UPI0025C5A67E|nr:hypothetical protein [Marivita sp.]